MYCFYSSTFLSRVDFALFRLPSGARYTPNISFPTGVKIFKPICPTLSLFFTVISYIKSFSDFKLYFPVKLKLKSRSNMNDFYYYSTPPEIFATTSHLLTARYTILIFLSSKRLAPLMKSSTTSVSFTK